MRDKRFVAEHRGGVLPIESHRRLATWARICAEHVVPLCQEELAPTLLEAIRVSKNWVEGETSTGAAIKASRAVHGFARTLTSPTSQSVARSIGQAVATAHMADHSLGAVVYALQAVSRAGKSVEEERNWQLTHLDRLDPEFVEFLKSMLKQKERGLELDK